ASRGPGAGGPSPEAKRLQEVAHAGQRRRVPSPGPESRPRAARALRQSRLPRADRDVRLLGDGLVPGAGPGARGRASGPGPPRPRPAPTGPRGTAGASDGRAVAENLRAPARRRGSHARRGPVPGANPEPDARTLNPEP